MKVVQRRRCGQSRPEADGHTVVQDGVGCGADIGRYAVAKVDLAIAGVGHGEVAWVSGLLDPQKRNVPLGQGAGTARAAFANGGTIPLVGAVVVVPGAIERVVIACGAGRGVIAGVDVGPSTDRVREVDPAPGGAYEHQDDREQADVGVWMQHGVTLLSK